MLGRRPLIAYSLGSFGTGVLSAVPAVLLLYYCTEVLGLPPAWAIIIVMAPKAWSILWDPFVGTWSDRSYGRWGRRRPFMAVGAAGVGCAFMAVFSVPPMAMVETAIWTGMAYFLLATFYSLFAVPYTTIPAEIGDDDTQRSLLVTTRMVFVKLGILGGAAMAPLLIQIAGGGREGYGVMSIMIGLLASLSMAMPLLMLRAHDPSLKARLVGIAGPGRDMAAVLSGTGLPFLALAFFMILAAAGALSSSTPYIINIVLDRSSGDIGVVFAAYGIASILTVPGWGWLGRRFGELRMLAMAAILYGLAITWIGTTALFAFPWPMVIGAFALAGLFSAAIQVLPFVAAANMIGAPANRARNGKGTLSGLWTATEKVGLATGPVLTGIALTLAGEDIGTAIPTFVIAVPLILLLLSCVPLHLAGRAKQVSI